MTLYDLLTRTAAQYASAPAIKYQNQVMTYAELLTAVEGVQSGLAALKVRKRGCVAVLLPNCPEFVISYLGAICSGRRLVPLNVLYRPDEARYILADCAAEVLITSEPFRPLVNALRPHLPHLRHVVVVSDDPVQENEIVFRKLCEQNAAPKVTRTERDVAVILYTSGTTGRPKGALLTHQNLCANAAACEAVLGVSQADCFFTALPLFHAFAAMVCLVLPISVGASMQLIERFLPSHTVQLLESSRATVFCGVPSMFGLLLEVARERKPDLSALRLCVSGGAPLPPEIWLAFEAAYAVKMVEGYGLTEASPVVAVNPPYGVRKPGSIGLPIPNISFKIVDMGGKAVSPGSIGELLIKGPSIMKGYLNKSAETKEVLHAGWLATGDLARVDEDGYLYIAGRKKELIIVGGLNVYPGEVERVLVEHPAILEAAAFGVPDATRGEAVWAAVVLRPEQQTTTRELQALCREKLASYKVPRGIDIMTELPKNALGKIMRHELHNLVVQRLKELEARS